MSALASAEAPPRRILVVDDELDILESLQELLQAAIENVEVLVAPSGQEALEVLDKERVDLIVSDFKMPGMNGMEFLRTAKDALPTVPRVLMTAFPDLQIAIEAINDARIENFFTKPLDPEEVVQVLSDMLENRRQSQQRDRAFARAMDMARRARGDA